MNKVCGVCGACNKSICASCSLKNHSDLQVQLNAFKRNLEGLTIWINEILERLSVQLANSSFKAMKREEES